MCFLALLHMVEGLCRHEPCNNHKNDNTTGRMKWQLELLLQSLPFEHPKSILYPMKLHIISLGCSKNIADSESIANSFIKADWQWSKAPEDADLLLVNTCGFIADAKEESLTTIMRALSIKKQNKNLRVGIFGCLVKRYHTEIEKGIPEIDFLLEFLSDNDIKELIMLDSKVRLEKSSCHNRRFFTPPHIGILKIAEGCSNRCSYCAIPGIRGDFCSLPEELILEKAFELADSGAKEISIVAQDITRYGTDTSGHCTLPRLVEKLSQLKGVEWIRLHYMHPRGLTTKLIDELYRIEKVVPYFDIPFQHISAKILDAMNRQTTPEHMIELIKHIRSSFPEATIRTTFIVGFPGEKKQDFDQLIEFIETYPLDRVGAFAYSPEESTPAFIMRPQVTQKTKQSRLDQLMTLQQLITKERNQLLIDKVIHVIIDEVYQDKLICRTMGDAYEVDNTTTVYGSYQLEPGAIIKIRIIEADSYDFIAELIK